MVQKREGTGVVHLVGGDRRGAADGREQAVQITGKTDMVQLVGRNRRGSPNGKEQTWCS